MEPAGVVAYRSDISAALHRVSAAIADEYGTNSAEFDEIEKIGNIYCDYSVSKGINELRVFIKAMTLYRPPSTRKICASLLRFKVMAALSLIQKAYISSMGISM